MEAENTLGDVYTSYIQYKVKYLLILSILISQFSYGQTCSNDSLFNRFKNDIQIELLRHDNHVVWDKETKLSYYTLMINCPIECLAKYVDDSIPSIRAMVFVGLAQKNVDCSFLEEILLRHKNDTAVFLECPTDVVITFTVSEFMQTVLKLKADNKIPNLAGDFESRLERLQNSLQTEFLIYIPGEYHGIISKKDILLVDSLTCSLEGFRVISFNLTISNKTFITNNIFTEEIRDAIRIMITGGRLYIEDIAVEIPDKTFRKVSPLILEIR